MITAVDTNILLDVFRNDPLFCAPSAGALRRCIAEGRLVACEIVWAETAAAFDDPALFQRAMTQLGIVFSPLDEKAAALSGSAWRTHRRQGGTRQRVLADFLIGAHARLHADRLLTRDRGFFRPYFQGLTVIDPTEDQ